MSCKTSGGHCHKKKTQGSGSFYCFISFLCDYANQSEEHMSFIGAKLDILKGEIASFHKKINKCLGIQRGRNFLAWHPAVSHYKKARTRVRRKPTSMDDEVHYHYNLTRL
jgi:hypothetical protein